MNEHPTPKCLFRLGVSLDHVKMQRLSTALAVQWLRVCVSP